MTSKLQPRVAPEALSWCINATQLHMWEKHGTMSGKAHRVSIVEDGKWRRHSPICGPQPVGHYEQHCVPAPVGWAACRHCMKKAGVTGVPRVFYDV